MCKYLKHLFKWRISNFKIQFYVQHADSTQKGVTMVWPVCEKHIKMCIQYLSKRILDILAMLSVSLLLGAHAVNSLFMIIRWYHQIFFHFRNMSNIFLMAIAMQYSDHICDVNLSACLLISHAAYVKRQNDPQYWINASISYILTTNILFSA